MEFIECKMKTAMEMRDARAQKHDSCILNFFFDLVENITHKKSYELLVQFVIYGHSVFFNF